MVVVTQTLVPGVRTVVGAPLADGLLPVRTAGRAGGYDVGSIPPPLAPWLAGLTAGSGGEAAESAAPIELDDLDVSLLPWAYAVLERLCAAGALASSVRRAPDAPDAPAVSVVPDRFATRPAWTVGDVAAGDLQPSPRMLLRFADGHWVAEEPGGGVQVTFDDPSDVRLLTGCAEVAAADLDDYGAAVLAMLVDNDLVVPAERAAAQAEATWEFHDYYFHHRSRPGRYHERYGGTYRFLGDAEPPPVLKPAMSADRIALATGPELSMPYSVVRDRRRSVRRDDGPLTVEQLGAFLWHVARVRGWAASTHDDVSRRGYPGGGARYELEVYPLVSDVEGLAAGAYHYDPRGHELERLDTSTNAVRAALAFAGRVSTRNSAPRVLFVVTARLGRVAWKYESIAYSLVLKHTGVLYAVMYDTATAMGLSPCALGAGNIDFYAQATGTDPEVEPAVGEFILGGAPPA